MRPETHRGRPAEAAPGERLDAIVREDADVWLTIRAGWVRAGDCMPRPGSLAWRLLGVDDPVRLAAAAAAELGTEDDVRRHGPGVARALATVAE